MKKTLIILALLSFTVVLSGPEAVAGSITELIGTDPYIFPPAPQPSVFFSPDPNKKMPNPLPVPDPDPNSSVEIDRLEDAVLAEPGSSATIPIRVGAFHLGGSPVAVDDSFFDVVFTLDLNQLSTGEMTIHRGLGMESGGTFDSFFDVFLNAHFEPVSGGTGSAFDLQTSERFSMTGAWIGVPVEPGLERFVVSEPVVAEDAANGGILYLEFIPEPAMLLLLCGAAAPILLKRRRST